MPEPIETPAVEPPAEPTPVQPPAPSAKKDEPPAEHMIPKSRLDEEITKRDKAEKALLKFQEAEDKRKKDELSEVERVKLEKQEADTRAEKAEKALTDERVENAVYAEANKAQFGEKKVRFANPELVYKLINLSEIEIKEGKPIGIPELVKALAKNYPNLLDSPPNGDRVGSPSRDKLKQQTENKRVDYTVPRI